MEQESVETYSIVLRVIHWVTALLMLGLLFVGFTMVGLEFSEDKLWVYGLHKSIGLLVLGLFFLRVFVAALTYRPKSLPTHKPYEVFLSKAVHVFLYFLMFALPMSGWVMSSAGDFPVMFFGIEMPDLTGKDEGLFKVSRGAHEILALVLIALVGLHFAGAAKHHVIDRDRTLGRMTWARAGFVSGLVVLLLGGLLYAPVLMKAAGEVQEEFVSEEMDVAEAQKQEQEERLEAVTSVEGRWDLDEENSSISFVATQYGSEFEGEFSDFDAEIIFDPQDLEHAHVHVVIDIDSIATGSDDRDEQARSAEWFDVGAYPEAVFEASSFEVVSSGSYIAHGTLTLRSVSLPVDLPFSLRIERGEDGKEAAFMEAELSLNRLEFGVGQGKWQKTDAIGDKVEIKIVVSASR